MKFPALQALLRPAFDILNTQRNGPWDDVGLQEAGEFQIYIIYHITYLRQEMVVSLCTAHDQIISAILLQMNISFIMMNT